MNVVFGGMSIDKRHNLLKKFKDHFVMVNVMIQRFEKDADRSFVDVAKIKEVVDIPLE